MKINKIECTAKFEGSISRYYNSHRFAEGKNCPYKNENGETINEKVYHTSWVELPFSVNDRPLTGYMLKKYYNWFLTFLEKGKYTDSNNIVLDSETIKPYLMYYCDGFENGYSEFVGKIKEKYEVFPLSESELAQKIFERVMFYSEDEKDDDYINTGCVLYSTPGTEKTIIENDTYYKVGYGGGEFYKAWELIFLTPEKFEPLFEKHRVKNKIDFSKTFPNGNESEELGKFGEFEEIDCKDEVVEKFNQHLRSFKLFAEEAPSKIIYIEEEIKEQERFRDGEGWTVTYDETISLYPFFKLGWDEAIKGMFEFPNNEYKRKEEIKEQIQEKYKFKELPKNYFEKLSKVCIDEAIKGMARYLYYVWLIEGAKEDTDTKILIQTKYTEKELMLIYPKLSQYIKCDLNSWLYWFGGVPTDKPKQIEFLKSIPELLYFMEILCPDSFKVGSRKLKELNQIFKPVENKKIDSTHLSTTVHTKKSAIDKLFK